MKISIARLRNLVNGKFRQFLERNKIFFEIFSLVGLGGMAIILSGAAVYVSSKQATIAEKQTQLTHIAQSPFIWVRERLLKNEASGMYEEQTLEVSNEGYRLSGFSSDVSVFFAVSTYDSKQGKIVAYVPVNGYYTAEYSTGRPTGLLATWKGFKNNSSFYRIYSEMLDRSRGAADRTYLVDKLVVVRVSYHDYAGQALTEYYIPSSSGGRRLPDEEGDRWFKQYRELGELGPEETSKLNSDRLIWYVDNKGKTDTMDSLSQ
jgi:hypothetical protein